MSRSEAWQSVVALQKAGRTGEADAMLSQVAALMSDAERFECLGNQAFAARKLQEAIDHYEKAITLEPDHIIARYQYLVGTADLKTKDYKAAFHRFVGAIEAEPEFVDPYVELGVMLLSIGDATGALRCFEDALAREPNELGHYHNRVAACQALAREDKANEAKLLEAQQSFEDAKKRLPPMSKDHVHSIRRA